MGNTYASGFSANKVWDNIIYHNHEEQNIEPLAGPKFLWDARFTESITLDDDSVTSWLDLYDSRNLNQYFGPDLTKAPTYIVSGIPTIHFNGVNNYLAVYPLGESSSNLTLFFVVSNLQTNLADNSGAIAYGFFSSGNLHMDYIAMNQIGTSIDATQLGVVLAQPKQIMAIRISGDGTVAKLYQNGGSPATTAITIAGGLDFIQIGSYLGDNYLDGDISWVAYYDSALSSIDMDAAFSYAGNAFGISVSPVDPL